MSDDDVKISYSAKELLERMDGKLDNLVVRVTALETDKVAQRRSKKEWREVVVALATVVASVGSTVGILSAVHGL